MTLTFNQFQKELRDREVPAREAYLFTLIYERLIETENQLSMCANLIASLADSLANVVELNAKQQAELRKVMRGGMPDGVDVHSVAWDDKE
jgi:predicted HTH domain antitoxin